MKLLALAHFHSRLFDWSGPPQTSSTDLHAICPYLHEWQYFFVAPEVSFRQVYRSTYRRAPNVLLPQSSPEVAKIRPVISYVVAQKIVRKVGKVQNIQFKQAACKVFAFGANTFPSMAKEATLQSQASFVFSHWATPTSSGKFKNRGNCTASASPPSGTAYHAWNFSPAMVPDASCQAWTYSWWVQSSIKTLDSRWLQ